MRDVTVAIVAQRLLPTAMLQTLIIAAQAASLHDLILLPSTLYNNPKMPPLSMQHVLSDVNKQQWTTHLNTGHKGQDLSHESRC